MRFAIGKVDVWLTTFTVLARLRTMAVFSMAMPTLTSTSLEQITPWCGRRRRWRSRSLLKLEIAFLAILHTDGTNGVRNYWIGWH